MLHSVYMWQLPGKQEVAGTDFKYGALTVLSRLAVAKTAVLGLNFKSLISRSCPTMRATMLTSKEIYVPSHNVTRPGKRHVRPLQVTQAYKVGFLYKCTDRC